MPQVSKKKSPLIMRGAFAYSAVKYFAQRQSGTNTYKANKRGRAAVRASVVCANGKYANGFPSLLEEKRFGASYALRASMLMKVVRT